MKINSQVSTAFKGFLFKLLLHQYFPHEQALTKHIKNKNTSKLKNVKEVFQELQRKIKEQQNKVKETQRKIKLM